MNYFLMLVILAVCGGAYYEYTVQQEKAVTYEQQISDLTAKVDSLQAENKKLADKNTEAAKTLGDTQTKLAGLTTQLQAAQKAAQAAPPPPAATSTAPSPSSSTPTAPSNNLGTIVTLDGRTFQNCQLLAVEADGITFKHAEGITKVLFPFLRPEVQQRFGYDSHKAAALTAAEIQYQEEQRKAAAMAGH